ncbi:unnamed protein product, partial [Didymodactylos carnosus]
FGSWQHTHEYLTQYANKLNLNPHICLRTKVISVCKQDDDLKNGSKQWMVTVRQDKGNVTTLSSDLIVVAAGLFFHLELPTFNGQEKFSGSIIHACSIKTHEQLKNKICIVIGGTKSAADMAVLAAEYGLKCYMIFRRINWFFPRYFPNSKLPAKYLFTKFFSLKKAGKIIGKLRWIDEIVGEKTVRLNTEEMQQEILAVEKYKDDPFHRAGWFEPIKVYLSDMNLRLVPTNNWLTEYFGDCNGVLLAVRTREVLRSSCGFDGTIVEFVPTDETIIEFYKPNLSDCTFGTVTSCRDVLAVHST